MKEDLSANAERFAGFADCYDAYRPKPPQVIVDILAQLAQVERPRLVVDLGCGTGLSTLIWAARAEEVVGVDPSADMRVQAEAQASALGAGNVSLREGYSHETQLADGSADIVTCSQALHWMEPESTFAEAARILRPGGVFAACDCDWPPTMNAEAEMAYFKFETRLRALEKERAVADTVQRWSKDGHLQRIKQSGRFSYVKEVQVHSVEQGNADRLVGLAFSQGGLQSLLKAGLSEDEAGLSSLRKVAHRAIGDAPIPWYFSYRVRIGVK